MEVCFDRDQLDRLDGLDLSRPPRRARRLISDRVINIIKAINFLIKEGRTEATASQVRLVLEELGLNATDRGSQYLGDTMGASGLDLPRVKKKGVTHYQLPRLGVTIDMIEERYQVPEGWVWLSDADQEEEQDDDQEDEDQEEDRDESDDE